MTTITVPIKKVGEENWLLLNQLGNKGLLRAVSISKPKQVRDWDNHHCSESHVKGSIRYCPRSWKIL